ncbi:uncharacterized protein LOC119654099 [Hermetia illucens]|uniref:uncharacterized protein LOC119654099 n=1 Tax=Hermetia illucens TaxID=343691 RepID=UPI0018CC6785|nr:uncharacterized protein LOC119654099 [Hermetia illucens]
MYKLIYTLILLRQMTIVEQRCYLVEIGSISYWFDPQHSSIENVFYNTTMMHSNVDIRTPVQNPAFILEAFTWNPTKGIQVLYNGSFRVCDFVSLVKRDPFTVTALELLKGSSNITLKCPILPNTYYGKFDINNFIRISPVRLFYSPNAVGTIQVHAGEAGSTWKNRQKGLENFTWWGSYGRCYIVEIGSISYWFDPKRSFIENAFFNSTMMHPSINIYNAVENPAFIVEAFTWNPVKGIQVFYNGSFRACDFISLAKRDPFTVTALELLKGSSNITLKCPIMPNTYYGKFDMNDFSRSSPVRLFYSSNVIGSIQIHAGEAESTWKNRLKPLKNFTWWGSYGISVAFKKVC